jgi:hypothetical protein
MAAPPGVVTLLAGHGAVRQRHEAPPEEPELFGQQIRAAVRPLR